MFKKFIMVIVNWAFKTILKYGIVQLIRLSREFDSYIFKNHVADRINPAFFMSTFSFYSMLFYVIM